MGEETKRIGKRREGGSYHLLNAWSARGCQIYLHVSFTKSS